MATGLVAARGQTVEAVLVLVLQLPQDKWEVLGGPILVLINTERDNQLLNWPAVYPGIVVAVAAAVKGLKARLLVC